MSSPVQTQSREQQRSLRIEYPRHHPVTNDNCVDATGSLCTSTHHEYMMLGHTENQGGHKRKPPQSSSNSYFQHNRSGNCNNVLDYDNPEKLFPYAGIPDLTRICLHEICSATDLHEFCPGEHFTSNKPRNSKVEPRFSYGEVGQKIATASLVVGPIPMRAQFCYCGVNRFQRVKAQKSKLTYDCHIILSSDTISEATCTLLLLSSLSLAFLEALSWSMNPPLGSTKYLNTKLGRNLAMLNLFRKKTSQTRSLCFIKESINVNDFLCKGFEKSLELGLVNETLFFFTKRKPMSIITSQERQIKTSQSSPGPVGNLDFPSLITFVDKGRSMTLKCRIKQMNNIGDFRISNGSAEGLDKIIRLRSLISKPNKLEDLSRHNCKRLSGDENSINFPGGIQMPFPELCHRSESLSFCDKIPLEREKQNLPKQKVIQRLSDLFSRKGAKHSSKLAIEIEKAQVGRPYDNIPVSQELKDYYRKVSVLDVLRGVIYKSSYAADNSSVNSCSGDLRLAKTFIREKPIIASAEESRMEKPSCQGKCTHPRGIKFSSRQASKPYDEECETSLPCVSCKCLNSVGAYVPRVREYEKRLKVFNERNLRISEVNSLDDGPSDKVVRTLLHSCDKSFAIKGEVPSFKQLQCQDINIPRKMVDTMLKGAVGFHKEESNSGKSPLCAKRSSIKGSPPTSERINKTKRITTLISHFPTDSFALNSANSVLEIAVTEKLMPLSISCLDDPVTALNFVSGPCEFEGNERFYEKKKSDPHFASVSKDEDPCLSVVDMVTKSDERCGEQLPQEVVCSDVISTILSGEERPYTSARNSLRLFNMFRENANLPMISFLQADKRLTDSNIPTVPPRDMINDRPFNDGSPLAVFFSARSHPQTFSPITSPNLVMIKESTEVNLDRRCQPSVFQSPIEAIQAGKQLSHISPDSIDTAGELLPVPTKCCVSEAKNSEERPKSILMQPDIDQKGHYTSYKNVHFGTSFPGITDVRRRKSLEVEGIFDQSFISKLRTSVEEESRRKNFVREKIDRLFAKGWNDSLTRDCRAITAHLETGNSTREKTNQARRLAKTKLGLNQFQIVTLGRSGELMTRYFQYNNGAFEPIEEESLWSWEYV